MRTRRPTHCIAMAQVYYVGSKDVRARIFSTEVINMKFNVLVTTYEYIMRDRAKLSKVSARRMRRPALPSACPASALLCVCPALLSPFLSSPLLSCLSCPVCLSASLSVRLSVCLRPRRK